MDVLLVELGLSQSEAAVLIALLELGTDKVSTIAKKAHLHRTTCYDILERLVEMGLINRVGDRIKKTYIARPPESIIAFLEKKNDEYAKKLALARQHLPQLKGLYNEKGSRPRVYYFEGKEGVEAAYEDTLTSQETILAYASVNDIEGLMPHYFPRYYQRRRDKGISIRAIFPATVEAAKLQARDQEESRTSILVPADRYNFSPEINIYNDKVIIISPPEEFAVIIQSKEIAEAQKKIFELAWKGAEAEKVSKAK